MTAESRHGLQIPRPSAGVFVLVAPVVFVGAQDVVAGFADHGDGGGGDQDQHWGVGVGEADAEVVQAAAVAQGEFAELVDGVVVNRPGKSGEFDVPRVSWSRLTGFQATGWAVWCRSSNSIGVHIPSAEWRRCRLWKISR